MGTALKMTVDPWQKGFEEAEIETLTGKLGLTDTGYWMLDAGLFVAQISEEVNVQLTRSPLFGT